MAWDFSTEPEFEEKLAWMRDFVRENVYPLETLELDWRTFWRVIEPLQGTGQGRRACGPRTSRPELGGQGYGQVKLALMHEILGASELAPPVFGNQAPDSGNSELIALAGSDEQKRPLAAAAARRRDAQRLLDDRAGHRAPTRASSRPPPCATDPSGSSTGPSGSSATPRAATSTS